MPTPAYLYIDGTKQGNITAGTFTLDSVGNIYQEGRENEIQVQAFDHQITVPRGPQSGQSTGPAIHQPLMITKVFDKSSPLLMAALTTGEQLPRFLLRWYRTIDGVQQHYFTTELIDAIVVDVRSYMPHFQDPDEAHLMQMEDVYFTYRKIIWTHEISKTTSSDDWRSPVTA